MYHCYDDLEASLNQLRVLHVDLWLMHWPIAFQRPVLKNGDCKNGDVCKDHNGHVMVDHVPILETWKAMECMYRDGKARAIGVSNFTLAQLEHLLSVCEIQPQVLQIEHHPYLQQHELMEFCKSNGIQVCSHQLL